MKKTDTPRPKKITRHPRELPFAPVESKIKLDLSPETFAHSDAFSKMMDRAERLAYRRNDAYSR